MAGLSALGSFEAMGTPPRARILVVDDDAAQLRALSDILPLEGFEVLAAGSAAEALALLPKHNVDLVLSDFFMPGTDGLAFLAKARQQGVRAPFILMTAFGTLDVAVSALRAGMADFVTKPIDASLLVHRLRAALELENLRSEVAVLKTALPDGDDPLGLIGPSRCFQDLLSTARRVAQSSASVLLLGESGTGKELLARKLHVDSARRAGPFVAVNCAAIPETLLEAELFGSVKGSYTGSNATRSGRFEAAARGTLFLDEIGELPLGLQPKLLRVLQDHVIEPIGGTPRAVDVRLVAATHRDLLAMVKAGTFREDLYYRLNVIPLRVPALRERSDDILPLAEHFLERFSRENNRHLTFSADAVSHLVAARWPGNVRELENAVERAVVLATSEVIEAADLFGGGVTPTQGKARGLAATVLDAAVGLDALERAILEEALERARGNVSMAARSLGLSRRTMQYRAGKLGLAGTEEP
jgi:DNA-binding NtrC family response regulator